MLTKIGIVAVRNTAMSEKLAKILNFLLIYKIIYIMIVIFYFFSKKILILIKIR